MTCHNSSETAANKGSTSVFLCYLANPAEQTRADDLLDYFFLSSLRLNSQLRFEVEWICFPKERCLRPAAKDEMSVVPPHPAAVGLDY